MQHNITTCEFVSPKHPDKFCDFLSDSILDAYLRQDPLSRVAVEVMGGHGVITVSGEVTSHGNVDIPRLVGGLVGPAFAITVHLSKQSPEIASGVDTGGAGDQGIMVGYATSETPEGMPKAYALARQLCRALYETYPYDGKVQVTLDNGVVATVVASFQNTRTPDLEKLVRSRIASREYLINPGGEWHTGGFDADSGLTGRKIVVDNYGPDIPVGGGAFSGKDYTKVDRSAAYMARKIAQSYLKRYGAREVHVKLAYAIGKKEPVMAAALIDDQARKIDDFDVRPRAIAETLQLARPIYAATAQWGHFGNGFAWD